MLLQRNEHVRFFKYGDSVYLRDTGTFKDYLFNDIVYDILSLIPPGGCTEEELLTKLSQQYDIDDMDAFRQDILSFLGELQKDGILLTESKANVPAVPVDIDGQVQQWYIDNHRLFYVCLELTYRCNERCLHCYIDDAEYYKELELEDYKKIIDEVVELGAIQLLLTGGEVSLYPDFVQVAEYATRKGLLVNIYTNGYNISWEMLNKLIALKPNSISFSFYGADAATHDKVTGIPGSFEKSMRTLMACKCAGVDTFIKSVALKQNIGSLKELYKLGKLLNIDVSVAKLVVASHENRKCLENFRLSRVEDYEYLFKLDDEFKKVLPQKRKRLTTGSFYLCPAGLSNLSVDPYGNVHPCNSLSMCLGNVKTTSLGDIWENSTEQIRKSLRREGIPKSCHDCNVEAYCNMYPCALEQNDNFKLVDKTICTIAAGAYKYIQNKKEK